MLLVEVNCVFAAWTTKPGDSRSFAMTLGRLFSTSSGSPQLGLIFDGLASRHTEGIRAPVGMRVRAVAFIGLKMMSGELRDLWEKFQENFDNQVRVRAQIGQAVPLVSTAATLIQQILAPDISDRVAEHFLNAKARELLCRLASVSDRESRLESGVALVVRELGDRLDRTPDMMHLARAAQISPRHLSRVFKQRTGTTIASYQLEMRLQEAAVRLAGNAVRVSDVAMDLGFADISHFSRAFKARFGQPPTRFLRSSLP